MTLPRFAGRDPSAGGQARGFDRQTHSPFDASLDLRRFCHNINEFIACAACPSFPGQKTGRVRAAHEMGLGGKTNPIFGFVRNRPGERYSYATQSDMAVRAGGNWVRSLIFLFFGTDAWWTRRGCPRSMFYWGRDSDRGGERAIIPSANPRSPKMRLAAVDTGQEQG